MELHKLKSDDIRGWDTAKRLETERDVRRALVTIRMDILSPKTQHGAKIRGLKKSLARLLTVRTEVGATAKPAASAKPAAPAKPAAAKKAVAKAKPAKAAAKPAKAAAKSPAKASAKAKTK